MMPPKTIKKESPVAGQVSICLEAAKPVQKKAHEKKAEEELHYLTLDSADGLIEYHSLDDITGLSWIEPTESGPDIEHKVPILDEEDFMISVDIIGDNEYFAAAVSEKNYEALDAGYGIKH